MQVSRLFVPQERRSHATALLFRDFSTYIIVSNKWEHEVIYHSLYTIITRHLL